MTKQEIKEWAAETVNKIFGHHKTVTMKGWVMRDKCGNIWFAKFKPHKTHHEDWSHPFFPLENKDFPSVKWEDSEPTRCTLTLEIEL